MSLAYVVEPAEAERSLDLVHLSRQTMGDRSLEREVLALFRSQARLMLFKLDAATDPHSRIEIAHSLKGAARNIGAPRVSRAAAVLEQDARDGRPMGEAVAKLCECVSEALGEIDELLSDR